MGEKQGEKNELVGKKGRKRGKELKEELVRRKRWKGHSGRMRGERDRRKQRKDE